MSELSDFNSLYCNFPWTVNQDPQSGGGDTWKLAYLAQSWFCHWLAIYPWNLMCKMGRKVTEIIGITLWKINEERTKSTMMLPFSECSISILSFPYFSEKVLVCWQSPLAYLNIENYAEVLSVFPSPTYHAFSFLNEKNISQLNNNVLYCCLHSIWHLPWSSYFLLVHHKLRDKKVLSE